MCVCVWKRRCVLEAVDTSEADAWNCGTSMHLRWTRMHCRDTAACGAYLHRGCRPLTERTASFKNPGWYAMLQNIAPGLGTERRSDLQRHMCLRAHGCICMMPSCTVCTARAAPSQASRRRTAAHTLMHGCTPHQEIASFPLEGGGEHIHRAALQQGIDVLEMWGTQYWGQGPDVPRDSGSP